MLIISRAEVFGREHLLFGNHRGHDTNGPTNDDPRNGSTPPCGPSLMDTSDPKAMLHLIVGARQALHVIAVKQPASEVLGDVAKVVKGTLQRPQRGDLVAHLRQVRPIAFTNALSCVLLWIGQDVCSLMDEPIGPLQGRPQGCR